MNLWGHRLWVHNRCYLLSLLLVARGWMCLRWGRPIHPLAGVKQKGIFGRRGGGVSETCPLHGLGPISCGTSLHERLKVPHSHVLWCCFYFSMAGFIFLICSFSCSHVCRSSCSLGVKEGRGWWRQIAGQQHLRPLSQAMDRVLILLFGGCVLDPAGVTDDMAFEVTVHGAGQACSPNVPMCP